MTQLLDGGLGPGNAPQLVIAAYADWGRAEAPPLAEVCAFARSRPGNVLLVDTFTKASRERKRPEDGGPHRRTLLDWLPAVDIINLCRACRAARVRVALAGALDVAEIFRLRPAHPEWFGVRGAACAHQCRESAIAPDKIHELRAAVGAGA